MTGDIVELHDYEGVIFVRRTRIVAWRSHPEYRSNWSLVLLDGGHTIDVLETPAEIAGLVLGAVNA